MHLGQPRTPTASKTCPMVSNGSDPWLVLGAIRLHDPTPQKLSQSSFAVEFNSCRPALGIIIRLLCQSARHRRPWNMLSAFDSKRNPRVDCVAEQLIPTDPGSLRSSIHLYTWDGLARSAPIHFFKKFTSSYCPCYAFTVLFFFVWGRFTALMSMFLFLT